MQVPRKVRRVVAIVCFHGRQHAVIVGIQVEPFLSGVTGNMRQKESGRQKERPVPGGRLDLLDGPACDLKIAFVVVVVREDAPVDQWIVSHGCRTDQLRLRFDANPTRRAPDIKLRHSVSLRVRRHLRDESFRRLTSGIRGP